jgi:hypothetical protein
LEDLPSALLWDITGRVFRNSRRACKALRDASSLPRNLRLRGYDADAHLIDLLANPSKRMPDVTGVFITRWPATLPRDADRLLRLLAQTFPRLTALQLRDAHLRADHRGGDGVARIAPLGSSLTSLELGLEGACISGLRGLTALRSLSLALRNPDGGVVDLRRQMLHWPDVLRRLSQLTKLDVVLHDSFFPALGEGWWVEQLPAAAPQLVSLGFSATLMGWSGTTIHALQRLPALQTVRVHMTSLYSLWQSGAAQFFDAYARYPGPAALELAAHAFTPSCSAAELTRLTGLAALDLSVAHRPQQADAAWRAVAVQRAVSRLHVSIEGGWAAPPAIHGLSALAGLPQQTLSDLSLVAPGWDPSTLLPCIAQLTLLQRLRLGRPAAAGGARPAQWPDAATAQLAALTRLSRLDVADRALPSGILLHLTALTRLRDLSLESTPRVWPPPGAAQDPEGDSDLAHLVVHSEQLTRLRLCGVAGVLRPGPGAVRELTALQDLTLASIPALGGGWRQFLLPLPPGLRYLQIQDVGAAEQERAEVAAAARGLDCCTSFDWKEEGAVTVD